MWTILSSSRSRAAVHMAEQDLTACRRSSRNRPASRWGTRLRLADVRSPGWATGRSPRVVTIMRAVKAHAPYPEIGVAHPLTPDASPQTRSGSRSPQVNTFTAAVCEVRREAAATPDGDARCSSVDDRVRQRHRRRRQPRTKTSGASGRASSSGAPLHYRPTADDDFLTFLAASACAPTPRHSTAASTSPDARLSPSTQDPKTKTHGGFCGLLSMKTLVRLVALCGSVIDEWVFVPQTARDRPVRRHRGDDGPRRSHGQQHRRHYETRGL